MTFCNGVKSALCCAGCINFGCTTFHGSPLHPDLLQRCDIAIMVCWCFLVGSTILHNKHSGRTFSWWPWFCYISRVLWPVKSGVHAGEACCRLSSLRPAFCGLAGASCVSMMHSRGGCWVRRGQLQRGVRSGPPYMCLASTKPSQPPPHLATSTGAHSRHLLFASPAVFPHAQLSSKYVLIWSPRQAGMVTCSSRDARRQIARLLNHSALIPAVRSGLRHRAHSI